MPGYLGNDPAGSATKIARQTYTTSGAATTDFTFTSGYDVGYLDVYVNGERQTKGKNFTASDGSTFKVLNGGVGTGSTVEAIAYKTFNLATVDFDDLGNTGDLTLTGDISGVNATFTGDVSIGGTLTYEDVTNIDSVGVITARAGVDIITGGIDIVGNTTGLNVTGVGTFVDVNVSGAATVAGDLVIADKIVHSGDTNTAIRFPAADTFTVETAGNEALRVQSDGDVGIGTINNSNNERLRVQDDATTSTVCQLSIISGNAERAVLNFGDKDDANIGRVTYDNRDNHLSLFTNNSEALRITSGGLVGIGTTNPAGTLEINAASTTSMITLDVAGTNFARLGHNSASGTNILDVRSEGHMRFLTNGNNERFRITDGGIIFTTNATAAGSLGVGTDSPGKVSGMSRYLSLSAAAADNAVGFELQGNRSGNNEPVARFSFINDDTETARITVDSATGGGANGNMLFATGGTTERLRITSGGNVDINGTPPWTVTGGSYKNLSISGDDASSSGFLWLGNGAAATNADFDLGRVNFVNGANIVAQIKGSTQTSANDDGRIAFFTKATGSSISEKVRITSGGRLKIGTISDYSAGVTNAPVYIAMQSDITGIGDDEGDTTAGMVRIEETGTNDGRYHGIELRNKNSGDIRIFNSDQSTLDRGDLILVMPDEDASDGTHLKMRVNSLKSSIQISGKGGAVAGNAQENHTDIYIATKTGMTAVNTGLGAEVAGLIRFEDKGTNNNRYHGIEIRNRNSGDARILNLDEGTTNKANLVFAIDNGTTVIESLRLNSAGNAVFSGIVSDSKGDLRKIIYKQETSAYTLVAADAGKAIEIQGNLTVPNNVFAGGDAITIINDSGSDKSISMGTGLGSMFNTADGTSGNLTLGGRGMATIYFVNNTTCYISGSQLS